jgi:hypothetical protein
MAPFQATIARYYGAKTDIFKSLPRKGLPLLDSYLST